MYQRTEKKIMQNWSTLETPLVTVCCITYNQQRYIEETIKSFLMQETDFPFEIIIHDDASTDNTPNIIKKYAEKYPHIIRTIFQMENQYSQGHDMDSFIWDIAKGEYLAICEGDDYWTDPKKLQIQTRKMQEYPKCHISFHATLETMNDETESLNPHPRAKHYEKEQVFDVRTVLAGGGSFMQTPSLMLHREVIENLPDFYYTAPAGDYVIQFLGALKGGALYINRTMAVYRVGADGSWRESIEDPDNYIKFQTEWVDSYLTINEYYDRKYQKEIYTVLRTATENLAKFVLFEKRDYKEFKRLIEIAYTIAEHPSFELMIWYRLRSFPLLLLFLSSALVFLSWLKRGWRKLVRGLKKLLKGLATNGS